MSATEHDPELYRQHRFIQPSGTTRLLIIRHGESVPAIPGQPFDLVDGHGDPALHPHGERQAELVGQRLSSTDLAAIYVTTLKRTHQTAAPLAARLGLTPFVEPDLREVYLGEWEGGILRQKAIEGDPTFAKIFETQEWAAIPGAERTRDFNARIQAGLRRIYSAHPDQTVAVVSHGGVIGQIFGEATGHRGLMFSEADNASISEIVMGPNIVRVRRFNDTSHLEGLNG